MVDLKAAMKEYSKAAWRAVQIVVLKVVQLDTAMVLQRACLKESLTVAWSAAWKAERRAAKKVFWKVVLKEKRTVHSTAGPKARTTGCAKAES